MIRPVAMNAAMAGTYPWAMRDTAAGPAEQDRRKAHAERQMVSDVLGASEPRRLIRLTTMKRD